MLDFPSSALPKAGAHHRTLSCFSPGDSRSSSLSKVWAEDYIADEYSVPYQNRFDDIIAPPAPATLIQRPFPGNVSLTYDEDHQTIPRQPRTHQRALTALLPFRKSRTNSESPQKSPQQLPVKERLDFEFIPTLTGDKDGQIKIADKSKGGLSGWFSGSSEPIALGLPVDDQEDTTDMTPPFGSSRNTSPDRAATKARQRPVVSSLNTSQQTSAKSSTSASRFAFFSPKTSTPTQIQISSDLADDLLNLNIRGALFPTGEVDPFSPSAFKNLLQSAEGILNRLQHAYKLRTISLHELKAEKEAQADELDEAETRAQHLKLQLEEMAKRVMAHDEEMKSVIGELVKEKQARAEEKDAREKSISLIKTHGRSPSEETSSQSEDLEVDNRQRRRPWRRSDGTINSEISFESDDESGSAGSVFSRSMSPSLASVSEISTPEMGQAIFARVVNIGPKTLPKVTAERPKPVQRRSTFQKILNGITPAVQEDGARNPANEDELGIAETGCPNCRGGQASVAWDTVGLLRQENKGLKERMAGLEKAVEGALDLVNGLRM